MKLWFGSYAWGWNLYGVSYKDKWFFGLSREAATSQDQQK